MEEGLACLALILSRINEDGDTAIRIGIYPTLLHACCWYIRRSPASCTPLCTNLAEEASNVCCLGLVCGPNGSFELLAQMSYQGHREVPTAISWWTSKMKYSHQVPAEELVAATKDRTHGRSRASRHVQVVCLNEGCYSKVHVLLTNTR